MTRGLSPSELAAMERALRDESVAAQARLSSLTRTFDDLVASSDGSPPDDEHDPEGATIGFERAQVSALVAQAEQSADAVARALDRIRKGTFGTCLVCGGPIPVERLKARPSAPTCVGCARRS